MEFGTFWPPEVTRYFGDKHTHDSDHAECFFLFFFRPSKNMTERIVMKLLPNDRGEM